MTNRLIFLYFDKFVFSRGRTVRDSLSGVMKLLSFKLLSNSGRKIRQDDAKQRIKVCVQTKTI